MAFCGLRLYLIFLGPLFLIKESLRSFSKVNGWLCQDQEKAFTSAPIGWYVTCMLEMSVKRGWLKFDHPVCAVIK